MSDYLEQHKPLFSVVIDFLKKEFTTISIGRANPALVQSISVTAYGNTMNIQELASITIPEARVLIITPWDKTIIKDIMSSLKQDLKEMQIIMESDKIRIIVPQMTTETREEFVKNVKTKIEEARIKIRKVREKIREEITRMEKEKSISEDDKFKYQKELDECTHTFTREIESMGDAKIHDIRTL